ncbi:hypothetical protein [Melghirimyces profundicolus]|nr:hypothetical protein [Melghirimyces profundicolus]
MEIQINVFPFKGVKIVMPPSYSFDPFVEERERVDFYRDDPFLRKLVLYYCGEKMDERLSALFSQGIFPLEEIG